MLIGFPYKTSLEISQCIVDLTQTTKQIRPISNAVS